MTGKMIAGMGGDGQIHIRPADDVHPHVISGEECWCGPTTVPAPVQRAPVTLWRVIHRAPTTRHADAMALREEPCNATVCSAREVSPGMPGHYPPPPIPGMLAGMDPLTELTTIVDELVEAEGVAAQIRARRNALLVQLLTSRTLTRSAVWHLPGLTRGSIQKIMHAANGAPEGES